MRRALAATLVLLAAPAVADDMPQCAPTETMRAHLAERYGEAPVLRGLSHRGALIEILLRPDGASWTTLAIRPNDRACVVDAGEMMEALAPPAPSADGT